MVQHNIRPVDLKIGMFLIEAEGPLRQVAA